MWKYSLTSSGYELVEGTCEQCNLLKDYKIPENLRDYQLLNEVCYSIRRIYSCYWQWNWGQHLYSFRL